MGLGQKRLHCLSTLFSLVFMLLLAPVHGHTHIVPGTRDFDKILPNVTHFGNYEG